MSELETEDALEEEREFLLRSLDDLEAERAAGNIDDETYQRLHDDYTARAAITVRAMRDGNPTADAATDSPPPSRRHRVLVVGGLVVFAVDRGDRRMAFALGARLPGETITGNSQSRSQVTAKERQAALEATVAKHPANAEARLALARFRLGRRDLRRRARVVPGRRRARPDEPRAVRLQRLDHPAPGLPRPGAPDPRQGGLGGQRPTRTPTSSAGSSCSGTRKIPSARFPTSSSTLWPRPTHRSPIRCATLLAEAVEAGK